MNRKPTHMFPALIAAALIAGVVSSAHAGPATYLSKDASHCDIFRSLSRVIPGECSDPGAKGPRTRGLVIHGEATALPKSVVQTDAPAELSIAMRIEFEFDSDALTPGAEDLLGRVAAVLNDERMRGKAIQIEGHADASGPEGYNLRLSERRARAVHAFLTDRHKVAATRLAYAGKGETEPFDAKNPTAGVNRRVEFKNLSD